MKTVRNLRVLLVAAVVVALGLTMTSSMAMAASSVDLTDTSWTLDAKYVARVQGAGAFPGKGPVYFDFAEDAFTMTDLEGDQLIGDWSTDARGRTTLDFEANSLDAYIEAKLYAIMADEGVGGDVTFVEIMKTKVSVKARSNKKGTTLNAAITIIANVEAYILDDGEWEYVDPKVTLMMRGKGFVPASQDSDQDAPDGVAGTFWSGTGRSVASVKRYGSARSKGPFDLVFGPYDAGEYFLYENEFVFVDTEYDIEIYGTYSFDGKKVILANFEDSLIDAIMDELGLYGYDGYVEMDITSADATVKVKPGKRANLRIKAKFDLDVWDGYQTHELSGRFTITGKGTPD